MIRNTTITTQAAIRNEITTLELGIRRTRERLAAFEKQYNLSSEVFANRFDGTDLKETLAFIEWMREIKTLRLLEGQRNALQQAQVKWWKEHANHAATHCRMQRPGSGRLARRRIRNHSTAD